MVDLHREDGQVQVVDDMNRVACDEVVVDADADVDGGGDGVGVRVGREVVGLGEEVHGVVWGVQEVDVDSGARACQIHEKLHTMVNCSNISL